MQNVSFKSSVKLVETWCSRKESCHTNIGLIDLRLRLLFYFKFLGKNLRLELSLPSRKECCTVQSNRGSVVLQSL